MNDFVKAVAIVSLVFLVTGIAGSFIYDENDEPAMESLFRGLYLNTPVTNIDFGGFKGIAVFYAFLYSRFDFGINYFGISLILFNWLVFVLLVFMLLKKKPAHAFLWSLAFLFIAFYNIFIVSFTTTPILASFAGQLLFLRALTDSESIKSKLSLLLLATLTIVLAYLVRPASAMLAMVLFVPIWIGHFLFNETIGKKYLSLLLILPILASICIGRQFERTTDMKNKFDGKAINIFSKINNFGYTMTIRDKTQEKLLYEVQNWFFFDKETQNIKDYESLLVRPQKQNHVADAFKFVFKSLFNRRSLLFIGIICIAFLMLLIFTLKSIKAMLVILSIGYYFGVLVAIALLMKMPPRVLIPTLLIAIYYIFISFPALQQFKKQAMSKFFRGFLIFVCVGLACYQVRSLARDLSREKRKADTSLLELSDFVNADKPEYVFFTWAHDFNYYPLKLIPQDPRVKLIPLVGWMSYYPQNYVFLKTLTGSNDVRDIVKWIADHPEKAAVYSDKDNNLVLYKIFAYHNISASLLPSKILDRESGKGFYRVVFNEI